MKIPDYVQSACRAIKKEGFEAYIVGGCVRDFLMGKKPKDWDITTNARPESLTKIFKNSKYNNSFGTVLLPIRADEEKGSDDNKKKEVITVLEITTYRSEAVYSDRRHPDEVVFEDEIEQDLSRRDFTINALAIDPDEPEEVIDLYGGQKDIRLKIMRAIGEPSDRFKEDALRMLRGVRFCSQLGFTLEPKTSRGIVKFVSQERIRDEVIKILASDLPYEGIELLHECKLLQYILPELEQGVTVKQDRHHIYSVYKHNLLALKYCPNKKWQVRLAALLHDVAKPKTRKIINNIATFYNHEYFGAKIVYKIMTRLKFSNEDRDQVVNLVKNHMFYYNVGEVTATSVRRLIAKVGKENLSDLIDLRVADRLGSGTPKAMPYKLRHLQYMMEKVQHDPVSAKMLKINGDDLINKLNILPGPKIGAILDVLLSGVIEEPENNDREKLLTMAKRLNDDNLETLRNKAKEVIEEKKQEEDKSIKKQFKV